MGEPQKISAAVMAKRIEAAIPARRVQDAGEHEAGGPECGAGSEGWNAGFEGVGGAGEHDGFADAVDEEAGGYEVVLGAEIFEGEERGGYDEADAVDGPEDGAQVGQGDEGSCHAKQSSEDQADDGQGVQRLFHMAG